MDRNTLGGGYDCITCVASREGGVDRNACRVVPLGNREVASREGGVDRNSC